MVIDPRPQIKADLERAIEPLRARLAETSDRDERRSLKRQIRAAKRDASRRLRTSVW